VPPGDTLPIAELEELRDVEDAELDTEEFDIVEPKKLDDVELDRDDPEIGTASLRTCLCM
jgi:hypothetical protein